MASSLQTHQAVLLGWRELAPGVRHFDFAVPAVEHLPYVPGQFVSLTHQIGGRQITRAYSVSSAPQANRFSLCLNLVPEGHFSPYLFALQPGDAVTMSGPLGTFTLRDLAQDMVWVATGTGVAPFRGMLDQWLLQAPAPRGRVTMVFGARYEEGLLYRADFERAAAANPDFIFEPTLSRPPANWAGRTGHVQPHVLEAIGARRDVTVYICGLKAMVDDLRAQLKALGLDRRQIVSEKFD